MKKIFTLLAAGAGLLAAIANTSPAQALSIQQFNAFPNDASYGALRFALTTEAYRNSRNGNISFANCIDQNLIPVPALTRLKDNIKASNASETENVESYILGSVRSVCAASDAEQIAAPASQETFKPTPVQVFLMHLQMTMTR